MVCQFKKLSNGWGGIRHPNPPRNYAAGRTDVTQWVYKVF